LEVAFQNIWKGAICFSFQNLHKDVVDNHKSIIHIPLW